MSKIKKYPGFAFIAPNMAFESPIMEIPTYDADGNVNGSEMVSIRQYFEYDSLSSFDNRIVVPLDGGTHSYGMFEMSSAKDDFENNKLLMKANGLKDSKDDYLDPDPMASFMLNIGELQEFLKVSPLNVAPVV